MRSTWPENEVFLVTTVPCCAGERDFHRVIVRLIAIDQHHRPLAVGPLDGVGGDQHISGSVAHVARGFELLVRRVDGLHPFFRDDLRREILRRITHHFVVRVDPQEISEAAAVLPGYGM